MKRRGSAALERGVSIIVPTYREAENLPALVERVTRVAREHALNVELIIVDDDSGDGTEEAVAALGRPWVRLIVRKSDRGLSRAVIEGLAAARYEHLVVMDADLSHPPEKIPELLTALDGGAEMAVGSRYVPGGTTDDRWGVFRWINSKVATLLARPFTHLRDPMSGFFALPAALLQDAEPLNPIGYKIGLEILVKCRCRNVAEVPIHFAQRLHGQSKLSLAEQLRYLEHVRRLFEFVYPGWSRLLFGATVAAVRLVTALPALLLAGAMGAGPLGAIEIAGGVMLLAQLLFKRVLRVGDGTLSNAPQPGWLRLVRALPGTGVATGVMLVLWRGWGVPALPALGPALVAAVPVDVAIHWAMSRVKSGQSCTA
ncbi:MAG: polyprenol monophosphomannose synthase [Phycisphaeraceae bacterium]